MDGTMHMSEENLAALRYFTENGGRFTLASGRCPSHFRETVKGLPINAPLVAVNGNVIYDMDTDRVLWSVPMPDETVLDILRFWEAECPESQHLTLNGATDGMNVLRRDGRSVDAVYTEFLASEAVHPVMKVIIVENPEISASMRAKLEARFPSLMFTQSWKQGIELNLAEGGKGNAVAKLRELLGGIHTVVCAGDYENDLSMIEYADIGYAVGNAIDKVKAAADRVTVPHHENAIAKIISELES